jgi:hypothetical protein
MLIDSFGRHAMKLNPGRGLLVEVTILAIPEIRRRNVHITMPADHIASYVVKRFWVMNCILEPPVST